MTAPKKRKAGRSHPAQNQSPLFVNTNVSIYIVESNQNKFFLISDKCPKGWMSFDNSCYKHEPVLAKQAHTKTAIQFCSVQYQSSMVVLNSRDEARYLAKYLADLEVKQNCVQCSR